MRWYIVACHYIFITGGCYSNPCLNDGLCSEVLDVDNPLAYRCSCPIGFTGYNCETRIDYCATQPCMNSGWCTSETTGFTCTCLQGFTGMILSIGVCILMKITIMATTIIII